MEVVEDVPPAEYQSVVVEVLAAGAGAAQLACGLDVAAAGAGAVGFAGDPQSSQVSSTSEVVVVEAGTDDAPYKFEEVVVELSLVLLIVVDEAEEL